MVVNLRSLHNILKITFTYVPLQTAKMDLIATDFGSYWLIYLLILVLQTQIWYQNVRNDDIYICKNHL